MSVPSAGLAPRGLRVAAGAPSPGRDRAGCERASAGGSERATHRLVTAWPARSSARRARTSSGYFDIWGNPYVYIHHRDYGTKFSYQSPEGLLFEVEAQKNPATGTYYAPTTFQLWSLGSDGENQNGEGDDIVSWN